MEKDFDHLSTEPAAGETQIQTLTRITVNGFNRVEYRLDRVENRLNGVEIRLDRVETRLDSVENRLTSVEGKIEGIGRRIDHEADQREQLTRRVETLEG